MYERGKVWRKAEGETHGSYGEGCRSGPAHGRNGSGLSLLVKPTGGGRGCSGYQHKGKRRDMGLGPFPRSRWPKRARRRSKPAGAQGREGRSLGGAADAAAEAARPRRRLLTFKAAAEALIESKRRLAQRQARLAVGEPRLSTGLSHARPPRRQAIDTAAVLEVLQPIWTTKPETASRVRQRIEAVLDYAEAIGARTGENPARWQRAPRPPARQAEQGQASSTTRRSTGARPRRSWPSWHGARAWGRGRWRSRS